MHTPTKCLLVGLSAYARTTQMTGELKRAHDIVILASMVCVVISSDRLKSNSIKTTLREISANGRRLLSAQDERSKAATASQAICGNAATGTPCESTNIRDCAGCMVGNFLGGCEA